jgi:hypothetical protein
LRTVFFSSSASSEIKREKKPRAALPCASARPPQLPVSPAAGAYNSGGVLGSGRAYGLLQSAGARGMSVRHINQSSSPEGVSI